MNYRLYFSNRNIPLVYMESPIDLNILTVENYCKWYDLYVVSKLGSVWRLLDDSGYAKIYWELDKDYSNSSHLWQPEFVLKLAEECNLFIDNQALEMIIGRWEMECLGKYEI